MIRKAAPIAASYSGDIGPALRRPPPAKPSRSRRTRSRFSWRAWIWKNIRHHQGTDQIRRSAPGNGSQSRRGRLDRGAAQEIRLLEHLADQVPVLAQRNPTPQRTPARVGCRIRRRPFSRISRPTGVNIDPQLQPDEKLRALNSPPTSLVNAKRSIAPKSARRIPRRCTSSAGTWTVTGGVRRRMMTVRELRWSWSWRGCFHRPTSRPSARSALHCGTTKRPGSMALARTSISERPSGQGRPAGVGNTRNRSGGNDSARHDAFDHGMPRADGTVSKQQRPEADVNIEFQSLSKAAEGAQKLAWDCMPQTKPMRPIILRPWDRT